MADSYSIICGLHIGADPTSIDPLLSLLSPVEEEVVRLRYGFARNKRPAYRELGASIGLSHQRVAKFTIRHVGGCAGSSITATPSGVRPLLEFVIEKRNEALKVERRAQIAAEEKAAAVERRRHEKAGRDDARHANA